MLAAGELAREGDAIGFGPGHDGLDGRGWVIFYAAVIRNFVEGYRIAARALRALTKGPMAEKDLVGRALRLGEQMFLAGDIERSEAVSRPAIENAFSAFVEQGYVTRADGKLALAESFSSEDAVPAIEGRIAGYLARRVSDTA
jgi:glycerol-3-phosphate O-acyltransferase